MNDAILLQLRYFSRGEKNYYGHPVDWDEYDGETMQELDRIRHDLGSPCRLIRGFPDHDNKPSAVDCVFPEALYEHVVMSMMRSTYSKGFYEGGSLHLDRIKRADGLMRAWMAFKLSRRSLLVKRQLWHLYDYEADGWLYCRWGGKDSWQLLQLLIDINAGKLISHAPVS